MAIRLKLLVIFILIYVTVTNFRCHRICLETTQVYSFQIGIRAYPDKDSIRIGDTLWLAINTPVKLMDQKTNKMINYSEAVNLGTAISFAKLVGANNTNDLVANDFKYDLLVGREIRRSDENKFREYNFEEINDSYQFKLGIIPKRRGVFKLFISNAANVFRKDDKCTKAGFEINFANTNQHLCYNQIIAPDITLRPGGGVYFFKVY